MAGWYGCQTVVIAVLVVLSVVTAPVGFASAEHPIDEEQNAVSSVERQLDNSTEAERGSENETAEDDTSANRTEDSQRDGPAGAAPTDTEDSAVETSDIGTDGQPASVAQTDTDNDIAPEDLLEAFVFAINEIGYFAYENTTQLETPEGDLSLSRGDAQFTSNLNRGTYRVAGDKRFSILTGDPRSSPVVGYYAVDQNGFGLSREIQTYVPPNRFFSGESKFIVFGYEDGSSVRVSKSDSDATVWEGTLDEGEHKVLTSSVADSFLRVTASKPVAALAYYDQGYYVPAANRQFTGEKFYTYAGTITNGFNDLTVTAYSDRTEVTIRDTETGETVGTTTLDSGEQYVEGINTGRYLTVESSAPISVAVQPHRRNWGSSGYNQNHYTPARSGSFIGREFVEDTLRDDYMYAFAYEDNTQVSLFSTDGGFERSVTLDAGEEIRFEPGAGTWRVIGNKSISMVAGFGTFSASFAPLEFGSAEGAAIEGTVKTTADDPIENASVGVFDARYVWAARLFGTDITEGLAESNTTGPDGTYSFENLEPGGYVVAAKTDKGLAISNAVFVGKGNTVTVPVIVRSNPISQVTDEFIGLHESYKRVHDNNTESAAQTLVRGYDVLATSDLIGEGDAASALGMFASIGRALDTEDFREVLESGGNPKRVAVKLAVEETLEAAIPWATNKFISGFSHRELRTFGDVATERQRLIDNAEEIEEAEWLRDESLVESTGLAQSQGYDQSTIYRTTTSELEEIEEEHIEHVESLSESEIPDEFSAPQVASVLEQQQAWVEGRGPIGSRTNGIIITPEGEVYRIKQTQQLQALFNGTDKEQKTAGDLATASAITAAIGDVATLASPMAGPYAPAVATAGQGVSTAATVGEAAFTTWQTQLQIKMSGEWVDTQIYWANDADNIERAYNSTEDWIREELENPRVQDASGELTTVEIQGTDVPQLKVDVEKLEAELGNTKFVVANKPEPDGDELVVTQWVAASETNLQYRNTGSLEDQEMRIIVANEQKGDQVSELPTVRSPARLDPGNARGEEVPFRTRFTASDTWENRIQIVLLMSEGKIVDTEVRTYKVIPDADYPVAEDFAISAWEEAERRTQQLAQGIEEGWQTLSDWGDSTWDITTSYGNDVISFAQNTGETVIDRGSECAEDALDCAEDVGKTAIEGSQSVADGAQDCATNVEDCAGDLVDTVNPFGVEEGPVQSSDVDPISKSQNQNTLSDESELIEYVNNASKVIDTDLTSANASVTTTVAGGNSTHRLEFIAYTQPGADVTLTVRGPNGRRVGYDVETAADVVGIPNASYSGKDTNPQRITIDSPQDADYTVTVEGQRFTSNSSHSVDVVSVRVPERPPILSIAPGRVEMYGKSGGTANASVVLTEIGKQRKVREIEFRRTEFRNGLNETLPSGTEADVSRQYFSLDANETTTVDLGVNLSAAFPMAFPTQQTRYDGHLIVTTANAGSVSVNVSALVLNTDIERLGLISADPTVEGAHVTEADLLNVSKSALPTTAEPISAYDTTFTGTGNLTLSLDVATPESRTAYVEVDGTWQPANRAVTDGELTLTVPARTERMVVTDQAPLVTMAVKPAPTVGVDPDLQTVSGGYDSTIRVRQLNFGVEVERLELEAGDQTYDPTNMTSRDWQVNATLKPTYNESTDEYETRTVTAVAEGATASGSNTLSVTVRRPGDATGDGDVTLEDAVRLGQDWKRTASGNVSLSDMNNDGRVDTDDAGVLRDHLDGPTGETLETDDATEGEEVSS